MGEDFTNDTSRKTLSFEDDAASSRSRWVAGGLALAIAGWMGSGYILPSEPEDGPNDAATPQRTISVAVRESSAQDVAQVFAAEGQALPDRDTMIRAEVSGQIGEVLVAKGADVEAGQILARFDPAGRAAQLRRAEEELARAQREYDNAQTLLDRGISTVDRVAQARVALAAAQSDVTTAEQTIGDTEIRAPFAGRLESLGINAGEFVSLGSEVGRIVDNEPLTIRIQIPQQSLRDIKVGQSATVDFITGETETGTVEFVGSSADAETRTFTAEITVPNENRTIPAGISAQLRIPTGKIRAHFVSPAILSLGTDGDLGIKTVNADDKVVFHPIGIVRAETDGIWVSGLPEQARIISIGQGFVNDGESVEPKPESDSALSRAPAETPVVTPDDTTPGDGQILSGEVGTTTAEGSK